MLCELIRNEDFIVAFGLKLGFQNYDCYFIACKSGGTEKENLRK